LKSIKMQQNATIRGCVSPEGGASKSTTYSFFAVGGFLFAQQFAQQTNDTGWIWDRSCGSCSKPVEQ